MYSSLKVIQKCIQYSNKEQYDFLIKEVKDNIIYLQKTISGNKILSKLNEFVPNVNNSQQLPSMRRSSLTKTQKKIFEIEFNEDEIISSEDDQSSNSDSEKIDDQIIKDSLKEAKAKQN